MCPLPWCIRLHCTGTLPSWQWSPGAGICWILKHVGKWVVRILLQCFLVFPAEITEEDEEEQEAETEETSATPGDQEEQSEAKDQLYGALILVLRGVSRVLRKRLVTYDLATKKKKKFPKPHDIEQKLQRSRLSDARNWWYISIYCIFHIK